MKHLDIKSLLYFQVFEEFPQDLIAGFQTAIGGPWLRWDLKAKGSRNEKIKDFKNLERGSSPESLSILLFRFFTYNLFSRHKQNFQVVIFPAHFHRIFRCWNAVFWIFIKGSTSLFWSIFFFRLISSIFLLSYSYCISDIPINSAMSSSNWEGILTKTKNLLLESEGFECYPFRVSLMGFKLHLYEISKF